MCPQVLTVEFSGNQDQIRDRIGCNSEKRFLMNLRFLNIRRLRASLQYSIPREKTREGPEKLESFFPLPSLLSPSNRSGPWREPKENRKDNQEERWQQWTQGKRQSRRWLRRRRKPQIISFLPENVQNVLFKQLARKLQALCGTLLAYSE